MDLAKPNQIETGTAVAQVSVLLVRLIKECQIRYLQTNF